MSDHITSENELFSLIKTDWDAETTAIVSYVPEIFWPGVEQTGNPDKDKYYLAVERIGLDAAQDAIASTTISYEINGLIMGTILCPKRDTQSHSRGNQLSVILRDSLRGKKTTSGVVLRNSKITESAPNKSHLIFLVSADYQYNEYV